MNKYLILSIMLLGMIGAGAQVSADGDLSEATFYVA